MKRLLAVLLLSLAVLAPLMAISAGAVYYASDDDLRSMCRMRGIDTEGLDRAAMQEALYSAEGLEAYTVEEEAPADGSEVTLSVNNAESLETEEGRVPKIVLSRFDRPSMDAVVLGGQKPEGERASALVHQTYDRYINKLCTRTLYDKDGLPYIDMDEYMKHRLQAKLVEAIVVKK